MVVVGLDHTGDHAAIIQLREVVRTSRWPASTNSTASRARCAARSSPVAWTIAGLLEEQQAVTINFRQLNLGFRGLLT